MVNTIVASSSGAATDFQTATLNAGAISTGGNNNLIEINPSTNGFSGALTITGVDPKLGLLANNGGPTQTFGLLAGGPAINAGDSSAVTNPPFSGPPYTDQRGQSRIRGGAVDLGAVESQIVLTAPAGPESGTAGSTTNNFALGSFASYTPGVSSWSVTVAWGDGAFTSFTLAAQGSLATQQHTFAKVGTYTVTVSVSDGQGDSGQTTFQVNAADAPLTAGVLTPPAPIASEPIANAVLFHFTDADPNGTPSDYTATVTWGDGSVETSGANPNDVKVAAHSGGGFDVIGSHSYAEEAAGLTFTVSVADAGGAATVDAAEGIFKVSAFDVIDTAVLHTDGSLTEIDPSGVSHLLSPAGTIRAISTVLDVHGQTDVFAISTGLMGAQYNNTLWEYIPSFGWSQLSSGAFQQISAALNSAGASIVFGLLTNGSLWEQAHALSLNAGWTMLSGAGTVQYISAVTDAAGNDHVYVIDTPQVGAKYAYTLWEHIPAGWRQDSSGQFSSISAGLNSAGQAVVYGILTNGQLWEQNPAFGPIGLDSGFHELSGMNGLVDANGKPLLFNSVQAAGPDKVFGIARDQNTWEHALSNNLATNTELTHGLLASQLSATQTQSGIDEVFETLIDGSFWEYSSAFPGNHFKELLTGGVAAGSTPE